MANVTLPSKRPPHAFTTIPRPRKAVIAAERKIPKAPVTQMLNRQFRDGFIVSFHPRDFGECSRGTHVNDRQLQARNRFCNSFVLNTSNDAVPLEPLQRIRRQVAATQLRKVCGPVSLFADKTNRCRSTALWHRHLMFQSTTQPDTASSPPPRVKKLIHCGEISHGR